MNTTGSLGSRNHPERLDFDERAARRELLVAKRSGLLFGTGDDSLLLPAAPPCTPKRPSSASYTPRRCRATKPGSGGEPQGAAPGTRRRPMSAPMGGRKTERWRETGTPRWPFPSESDVAMREEALPYRKAHNPQPHWMSECWLRSLRRPGLDLEDPFFGNLGNPEMRELHEQWRGLGPPTQQLGAYSGFTTSGPVALRREPDPRAWIERPVAVGIVSLEHMNGSRYAFQNQGSKEVWQPPAAAKYFTLEL